MPCFIVGPGSIDRRIVLLKELAEQLGLAPAIVADFGALKAERAYAEAGRHLVLVPALTTDSVLVEAAVRFAQAEHAHAFVVYIADTIAPEIYKQLVRTHAGDWITWEALPQDLRETARTLTTAGPSDHTAKVLSVVPSKGGVGNTLLALETGVHLAARRKRSGSRVAILDLNLQGGTLADSLDVQPRFDIREIMGQPERLDEQLIDIFTSRYSPRLDVFASPIRAINVEEIDPQVIFAFVDAVSLRYDVLVLDIPQQWFPWTDNVLQGSDAIVIAGGSTVPAVKQLAAKVAHLDQLSVGRDKVAVAVNQCDANLLGRISRRPEIERALVGRRIFYIRQDVAAVTGALDAGRPLIETAPGNKVSKDIRKLAEWVERATDRPHGTSRDETAGWETQS